MLEVVHVGSALFGTWEGRSFLSRTAHFSVRLQLQIIDASAHLTLVILAALTVPAHALFKYLLLARRYLICQLAMLLS